MSKQMTLGTGFRQKYSKATCRENFLTGDGPRCAVEGSARAYSPVYPKPVWRPPKELEMMLRVYFVLQQWLNLGPRGWRKTL